MNPKPSVFVTGAAKGIGAQTALMFGKHGYRVGATDANEYDLQALKALLGPGHFYRRLDVTQADGFAAVLHDFATENKGVIDVLVNNAGAEYGVPSEASYSASKIWVKGFTEVLNIEWERHGIYVCDIMPNFVATPMMQEAHGKIVDSIGIRLTAEDVSQTLWRAVQNRRRVHWKVDTWRPRLLRAMNKLLPATVRWAAMKHLSGY